MPRRVFVTLALAALSLGAPAAAHAMPSITGPASVADSAVAEGQPATVTLAPRGPSPHETQVTYATVPGTAGPADFTAVAPATVTWAPNDTAPKSISIPTSQDALDEDDEQFGVLFGAS